VITNTGFDHLDFICGNSGNKKSTLSSSTFPFFLPINKISVIIAHHNCFDSGPFINLLLS